MTPRKRDNKQFDHACREAGIGKTDKPQARDDFHRYKQETGHRADLRYQELVEWLKDWSYDWNR